MQPALVSFTGMPKERMKCWMGSRAGSSTVMQQGSSKSVLYLRSSAKAKIMGSTCILNKLMYIRCKLSALKKSMSGKRSIGGRAGQ
eukprot:6187553-Pleurochrysis_carterae.AAC.2